MDIKKLRNEVISKVSEKSPEILIGIGLAGMLTSTVLAVKATPKALDILEEHKDEDLTKFDKVKLTWKCYIPAAVSYCTSTACIIASSNVSLRRNAVLAGAYKVSEAALLEYRNKVVEVLGEEKEKEIRTAIAEDRIDKDMHAGSYEYLNHVVMMGNNDDLCYDVLSGRYFNSNIDKIKKAMNDMNYRLLNDNILSLNEFYNEIGLQSTDIGYEKGWNISDGMIDISFSSIISDNDQPCIVMHFENEPKYKFDRYC